MINMVDDFTSPYLVSALSTEKGEFRGAAQAQSKRDEAQRRDPLGHGVFGAGYVWVRLLQLRNSLQSLGIRKSRVNDVHQMDPN